MNKKSTPHACFKVAPDSTMIDGNEILKVLKRGLSARYDSAPMIESKFFRVQTISLQANQKSYVVCLFRNRFDSSEFILLVDRNNNEHLLNWLRGRKSNTQPSELRIVSHDIHALLASTPGISAIRWYFEGRRTQGSAVATPDELGW